MFLSIYLTVAWAGPEDAEIVNGQVTIQQSGYNTVITASDNSIINYSSFDILQPEIVEFIQPGSSASVLNRILSANPTNINGTLLANGRVFFVNPAGVYIGAGARINVSQLVASGLDISNSDFINGRYYFVGGDGFVINCGDILAEQVYLIGKQVANSGNINCPDGYVVMAAGDRVFLGEPGSDIVLEIDPTPLPEETTPTNLEPAVLNEGTVDAAGGTIVLAAAGDIYSQAISNVGSLSVSVETDEAGQIKLLAPDGQITNTGTIVASGDTGGSVNIDGGDVVLTADSVIHADGMTADAGDISIHGTSIVEVGSEVLLTADAQGDAGDGGSVIVLGDEMAIFEGIISAQGGRSEGDGGFAEVSGKHVKVGGHADLTAAAGQTGEFLIDPGSVNIIDGDDTAPDVHMDTFNDGWIENQLGLSLLTIDTTDSDNSNAEVIDFAGDAGVGWATGYEFKLKAGERIDFRGTVSSTGGGNFVMDSPTVDLYSSNITVSGGGELSGTATTVNIKSDAVSIGTGIAVADNTGATINIAAGTYTEDLTIDKSVTLEGAQAGVAVSGRTAGGTSESTIVGEHTITGSTVNIDGFTLSDPDLGSGNVLVSLDSSGAAIDDVTLTNNFMELGSGDVGIDFGGTSSTNQAITNVAIEDSVFSGPSDKISNPMRIGGWFGTDYDVEVGDVTFQRNTVNYGSIPIQLQDDNLDNITITQNTFTNTDGTVYVWGNNASPTGILSNFEYSENSVDSTNTYGLGIDVFDVFGNSNFDDTIAIINNSFDGVTGNYGFNAVSILSSAFTGTIDASGNWYGTNTATGVVGEVSANVDYTPWLDSGTDTDLVTPGFQGDFSTLHVSATSPQSGVLGRIDEAIGLATIGGKINAMAGTYNETVNVNKNLAGIYFQGTSEIDGTVTLNADLDIYTQNDGDLTLNTVSDIGLHSLSVDTGTGTLNLDENITANGGITLDGGIINVGNDAGDKITSDGTVSITAAAAVTIDAAIDPSAVAITSNSDLTINNTITADDLITATAGLVGGVGNVTLNSTGALETSAAGSDIQIAAGATTGDISLAGNVTAADEVTMTALGGSILDTGSGMIAADSASLSVKTEIGSAANSVNTSVSSLIADAGGDIYINETNGLTSADLHSTAGNIDLTAGGTISSSILTSDAGNVDAETIAGDIGNTTVNASGTADLKAAGSINNASVTAGPTATLIAGTDISEFKVSADSINMTATAGMIADTDVDADITATSAILGAGSSIGSLANPIDTDVSDLTADAGGDIYINETDGLTSADLHSTGGDVDLKAGDTISGSILTADAGNVDAETTAGDINNTTVNASGTANLDAAGIINNASVTAGPTATLIAGADISEFNVSAASINMTATAGIIADTDALTDLTGTNATLNAGTSTGSAANPVNTEIASLIAVAAEDIYIHETDAVELVDIDTSDGDIQIKAGGQMTATDVEAGGTGDVVLTTTGTGDVIIDEIKALDGIITIDSAGMISEVAETEPAVDLTAYELNLDAESGIYGSSPIETSAEIIAAGTTNGDIDIDNVNANPVTAGSLTTGDGNILFSQSGGGSLIVTSASTTDGSIGIDVDNATLTAQTVTAGGTGDVVLTTTGTGDVIVDQITALDDMITVDSAGMISEVVEAEPDVDLTAAALSLTADTGISGQSPIETSATDITTATDAGDIDIDNTNASTTTVSLAVTTGVGDILFSQDGDGSLIVTSATTADGSIGIDVDDATLTAQAVTAGGDDIDDNVELTTTTNGDVIVDDITAVGNMITIISEGAISEVVEAEPGIDLTASTLSLTADTGISGQSPIETSATDITAATDAGDIDIENLNSNPVTAGSITTGNGNILFSQSGGGSLEVTTAGTSDGNIEVDVTGTDANLKVGNITAGGSGNVDLEATEGGITQDSGTITANGGSITMTQRDALDIKDFTFANQVNTDISLQSYDSSVTAVDLANGGKDENAADKWKSITATAEDNIELQGSSDIKIGGDLTSTSGGVSIISDNGGIYDAGSYDYTMMSGTVLDNVNVTGYSDGTAGVDLPAGSGKAAIIFQSKKDLKLGQNCNLTAEGSYDPSSDERQDVIFKLDGDPIDIAIYLSSFDSASGTGANVDIGSSRISINNSPGEGTLVIDAYDTVTFTDTFENSLKLAGASDIKRLEATSRITPDLQSAINFGTLPHADNPAGIANGEFVLSGGVYVLRGPASLLAKASILALTGPVPLVPPVPLEAEDRGEVEEDDRDALMQWLVEELGEGNVQTYLARAYPPSLNTDLRPYKAAARLRNFATIIKDTEGDQIAALTQVVNEFIDTPEPPSEEQMALIVSALTEQAGAGTHYALAAQWIDSLVEYVGVLNTEIGWSSEKSVAFVMNKYGSRLTEGGDIRAAMFVQMYMEESFGG